MAQATTIRAWSCKTQAPKIPDKTQGKKKLSVDRQPIAIGSSGGRQLAQKLELLIRGGPPVAQSFAGLPFDLDDLIPELAALGRRTVAP
ncbi:hypothetical protein [Streptomyces sp. NPDC057696]|uniref:hypothetical protein n=1 Tax=unclassified Streptomyces TaxID=2593676 RepID=UPI0036BFFE31